MTSVGCRVLTDGIESHRRTSVFGWVAGAGVREEQMPAIVAPKGFQTHQGFVARLSPKLSRPLEACLILPTV